MSMHGGAKPYIALIIAIVSISWASIFARLSGAPSLALTTWRLVLAFVILGFVLSFRESSARELKDLRMSELLLMFISGTMLSSHLILWLESLMYLPVAISVTIVDTYPLLSLIIGYAVFKERPSWIQVLGILLTFSGVVLLSLTKNNLSLRSDLNNMLAYGVFLALGGSIAAGIYFSIGKYLRRRYTTVTYATITYGFASLVTIVISLASGVELVRYSSWTWLMFLLFALVPMIGGHTMINYALRYFPLASTISVVLSEPVGATLLAIIVLNEIPPTTTYVFMAQILVGLYLALGGYSMLIKKSNQSVLS